jgi:hypothetical protein
MLAIVRSLVVAEEGVLDLVIVVVSGGIMRVLVKETMVSCWAIAEQGTVKLT